MVRYIYSKYITEHSEKDGDVAITVTKGIHWLSQRKRIGKYFVF